MKALLSDGRLIDLRIGQGTLGIEIVEIRLEEVDILHIAENAESMTWFLHLATRFKYRKKGHSDD